MKQITPKNFSQIEEALKKKQSVFYNDVLVMKTENKPSGRTIIKTVGKIQLENDTEFFPPWLPAVRIEP